MAGKTILGRVLVHPTCALDIRTMATTHTQLKAVSDGQNTTDEMPDVRRSEVAQVIPLPGIEQVDEFAEWQEMADVVRDGVMAAINE